MTFLLHHRVGELCVDYCRRPWSIGGRGATILTSWSFWIGPLGVSWVPLGEVSQSLWHRLKTRRELPFYFVGGYPPIPKPLPPPPPAPDSVYWQ
jgi:hypothetical protein